MSQLPTIRSVLAVSALGAALTVVPARSPLCGQIVRGAVTERVTNAPLPGVVVSVLDTTGATILQLLSDERGAFDIRLPGAGTFALDVKRIGVRHLRLAPFAIAAGETRRMNVAVDQLPAVLSSVRVTGRTACVRNPETNARTAGLWEDARAALTAAVLTRNASARTDTVVRFQRKLDAITWRVMFEDRRRVLVDMNRPFRSLPAEELSEHGYVRPHEDGTTDYYAPDADALLSNAFLLDHCFRIEPGTGDRAGYVGLGFEPVPTRRVPDIAGVLWMDARTAELRTLEFHYTWVPNDIRPDDFGGVVSFFRMPGGRWIVRSWRIRMPEYSHERVTERYDGTRVSLGRTARPVLARIAEEGGAVPLTVLLAQAGRVVGAVVVDTITNRTVGGITVALRGTGDSTITGPDGSFELPFVQPGSYTVVLRHPLLDSLGLEHDATTIDVEAGRTNVLRLHFPTTEELATRMCERPFDTQRHAIIRFLIVDGQGKPLANTPAKFSRAPLRNGREIVADSVASYDVTLDQHGGFLACGVGGDEVVRIEGAASVQSGWGETVRPRAGAIGWHVIHALRPRRPVP